MHEVSSQGKYSLPQVDRIEFEVHGDLNMVLGNSIFDLLMVDYRRSDFAVLLRALTNVP